MEGHGEPALRLDLQHRSRVARSARRDDKRRGVLSGLNRRRRARMRRQSLELNRMSRRCRSRFAFSSAEITMCAPRCGRTHRRPHALVREDLSSDERRHTKGLFPRQHGLICQRDDDNCITLSDANRVDRAPRISVHVEKRDAHAIVQHHVLSRAQFEWFAERRRRRLSRTVAAAASGQ